MKHVLRAVSARVIAVAVIAAATLFATATLSFATPAAPVLSLTELDAKLQEGPLTGHFDTVLRGETITHIPCTVLAVTGDDSGSSLILFQASGPQIDAIGGIAAGMSGSPIYLEDEGVEKIVGAVSYGDYYTLGGTGLATPIESMMDIVSRFVPSAQELAEPVLAGGSVISRVIVSSEPERYSGAAAQGALVAEPLSSVFIGGIRPQSKVYKALANDFRSSGISVVPLASRLGTTAVRNGAIYSAPFVDGGSIGALGSRGDLWVGGIGTVTYTSGDKVLAFGHPAFWDGPTNLYLTNAWIDGVWPSQYSPYKLGRPGAVGGAVVEDRSAGIMGVTGTNLAETPVTAKATNASGETTTSVAYFPTKFLAVNDERSLLAASAAYVAGSRLFDQMVVAGSAVTTTTVVVADASAPDTRYTVKLRNLVDDAEDVPSVAIGDVYAALTQMLSITESGLAQPLILSVDLEATYSPSRRNAEIVGLSASKGLLAGTKNPVKVSLLKYGVAATQTVDATISIPAGTRIEGGTLSAAGAAEEFDVENIEGTETAGGAVDRRSVAQVASDLNGSPRNNGLVLRFYPGQAIDDLGASGASAPKPVAETTVLTDSVITGSAEKDATRITAALDPSTVSYNGSTWVWGDLFGIDADTTSVYVYGKETGSSTEKYLGRATAENVGESCIYELQIKGLKKTTAVRVVFRGDNALLGCEKTVTVKVKAAVSLSTSATYLSRGKSVKLTAGVSPTTAKGSVVFEYYKTSTGKWIAIATKTLSVATGATSATASHTWVPPVGTFKLRARYVPATGATNIANNSGYKYVYVR